MRENKRKMVILFLFISFAYCSEHNSCKITLDVIKRACFEQKITTEAEWEQRSKLFYEGREVKWKNYVRASAKGTSAGSSAINSFVFEYIIIPN